MANDTSFFWVRLSGPTFSSSDLSLQNYLSTKNELPPSPPPPPPTMASNSRIDGGLSRIKNAGAALYDDNQHLIGDLRKFMVTMKEIAIDLEKENQHDLVKQLENGLLELIQASDNSAHLSSAIDSIKNNYQPGEQLTDFDKLFEEEIARIKATSTNTNPQNHSAARHFREAVWNVHHAGQPMPGEEQEDIVMTSTESNLLNVTCPISGKPVVDIEEPVRSTECKHIYEKAAVMHYIKVKKQNARCPVAGCPKMLQAERVVKDPLLLIEIEDFRNATKKTGQPSEVEDYTELD